MGLPKMYLYVCRAQKWIGNSGRMVVGLQLSQPPPLSPYEKAKGFKSRYPSVIGVSQVLVHGSAVQSTVDRHPMTAFGISDGSFCNRKLNDQ